jgi:flagellar biogenesis protein FliO
MNLMYLISDNLKKSLNITWQGMLKIFIAMAVIFAIIWLLSKIKERKEE